MWRAIIERGGSWSLWEEAGIMWRAIIERGGS